jgi:ketosteroid isomerase-like protein
MEDTMAKTTILFLVLILFIVGLMSILTRGVTVFDKEKELQAVESTIRNSIGWAKDKDLDLLYNTIANDSNYTEIQPGDKVVRGFEEFKQAEAFWMHDDFKAVRYEIRDLRINFSQDGKVAWWYCKLDDINTWKGQPANWENARWTGVLEKRAGEWKIVQMHFSYAEE